MKLAFIGIGKVGFALANNLQKKAHQVIIAHDDAQSQSVRNALEKNSALSVLPIQDAIDQSEMIFLATPFKLNEVILKPLDFKGKILIDCTNPVGPGISHGLESKLSGAEQVEKWANNALIIKAFTIYGYENLENSSFPDYNVKPAMLIAGNHQEAKNQVSSICDDLGYQALDVGNLSQSLHLEHMTLLWVKMVRANGHNPNFTWAYLERS